MTDASANMLEDLHEEVRLEVRDHIQEHGLQRDPQDAAIVIADGVVPLRDSDLLEISRQNPELGGPVGAAFPDSDARDSFMEELVEDLKCVALEEFADLRKFEQLRGAERLGKGSAEWSR